MSEQSDDIDSGIPLPDHLIAFTRNKHQMSRCCDATIICEGRKFPVSKVVLAATSKYFNCLFSHPWAQDEMEFHLKEPTSTGLAEMLTHLTGGRMTLTMANACDVLHAADFLIVPAASKACSAFLVTNLKPCDVLGVNVAARRSPCSLLSFLYIESSSDKNPSDASSD